MTTRPHATTPHALPGPTVPTAPPFAYYGGKTTLADRIVELLPAHRHYVEPFAGSLAVLLAKPPALFETVNDLDQQLTFWRVLRDRGDELARVCYLTPHSRAEHQACQAAGAEPTPGGGVDELEVARRVWVMLTQGRGGTLRRTGWRHFQDPGRRGPTSMPAYLAAYVERMAPAIDRLRRVSLECRPALKVIADYGRHREVCIYADPPYLGTTRSSRQYRVEMTAASQHEAFAAALHDCTAAVVRSGYASPLYDDLYRDWHRLDLAAYTGQGNHAGQHRLRRGRRIEVLWSNRPLAVQPTLWSDGGSSEDIA